MRRIPTIALVALAASLPLALAAYAQTPSPRIEDYFTPEQIARAADYRGTAYVLSFSRLALELGALALLAFGPGARRLRAWVEARVRGRAARPLVLVVVVVLTPVLASLGLRLALHDHAAEFGIATNSAGAFLLDVARATGISLVLTALGVLLFLLAARRLPRAWPAAVASGAAALTLAGVFLYPLLYEPVFNRFTPAPAEVRARVLALAGRAGVGVGDVLIADASRRTSAANAYVSGFGATKRVVLYDTLVTATPADETDFVVAHELSHEAHGDVIGGTLLGIAGSTLGVVVLWALLRSARVRRAAGVAGPADPLVVPFLAFLLAAGSILTLPVANAYSRSIEARADRTAIELTGDPDAAIALEVRLAVRNLSDLRPNAFVRWMFFSHPSTIERIAAAETAR
ncbi:MAG TPA: M48 family metalloprotease [Actinomycetota bacterium]